VEAKLSELGKVDFDPDDPSSFDIDRMNKQAQKKYGKLNVQILYYSIQLLHETENSRYQHDFDA
jgi:hypothetical protein